MNPEEKENLETYEKEPPKRKGKLFGDPAFEVDF